MKNFDDNRLPDELEDVGSRLREQRAEMTPLELDQMKRRISSRASRAPAWLPKRGTPMKSRVATLAVTALLIGGTTAGGIAAAGGNGNNSSANSQYRPGLGCGDQNHIHTGPPGNPGKTCK
jgi:hypothetical protein